MGNDKSLLSSKAIEWLSSVGYATKTHEERMALIDAARIAYPNVEDDLSEEERLKAALGLA